VAANYYYLVSSLPALGWGRPMPLTRAEFLTRCERELPAREFTALAGLTRAPREQPCCAVEAAWNAWEIALRNGFVRLRASRLDQVPDAWLRPEPEFFPELERQVMEAFDGTNPREERQELDRLRWQRLATLEIGHYFDFEFLVLYHLKLILLEKWAGLSADQGLAQLHDVVRAKLPQLASLEPRHAKS
jgi:hypothetical protein